jgi:hypothetical protein
MHDIAGEDLDYLHVNSSEIDCLERENEVGAVWEYGSADRKLDRRRYCFLSEFLTYLSLEVPAINRTDHIGNADIEGLDCTSGIIDLDG